MTTHIMSFTYAPKIEGVRNGTIRQTIRKWRKNRTIRPGDYILFHGWEGRPYRSKWSWRKKVKVTEVYQLLFSEDGVYNLKRRVDDGTLNKLARDDGIIPTTGEALKEVLKKLNGPEWEDWYEVIRWEPCRGDKE